jgi:hypothetical protein
VRVAIVALVLWMFTAGVGTYLLATATRLPDPEPAPAPAPAPAKPEPAAVAVQVTTATPPRDPFAPPSLQRDRAEELPMLRSLAEFAHPALGIVGLGFWFGYVLTRDRLMLAIGLGILLGAIAAGIALFTANTRAARGAAAAAANGEPAAEDDARLAPPSFSARVLALHGLGAALTLLFAALIAARA